MALNVVVLMGRLVRDPELKSTGDGVEYCKFAIAVDRRYAKGEDKQADFIDVVAWRQTAVFIQKYFAKGSMIAVQGSIQTRSYEDRDGNKRKAVEILADNVSFCGSKSESGTAAAAPPASAPKPNLDIEVDAQEIPDDDDLPF